jgi:uncharacterized protein (DUF1786 family)
MQAKRNMVASTMKLAAAGKLKGQGTITDAEREMLSDAATVLSNESISPELAKTELERVKVVFENIVSGNKQQAPQDAIDYLMANPQFKDDFLAKFGYLPEGV